MSSGRVTAGTARIRPKDIITLPQPAIPTHTFSAGDKAIVVKASASTTNDNPNIVGYRVKMQPLTGTTPDVTELIFTLEKGAAGTPDGMAIPVPINNKRYRVSVASIGFNGDSAYGATQDVWALKLDPPTNLAAAARNTSLALTWTPPVAPSGFSITGYVLQYWVSGNQYNIANPSLPTGTDIGGGVREGVREITITGAVNSYTLTGLTTNVRYTIEIAAVVTGGLRGQYARVLSAPCVVPTGLTATYVYTTSATTITIITFTTTNSPGVSPPNNASNVNIGYQLPSGNDSSISFRTNTNINTPSIISYAVTGVVNYNISYYNGYNFSEQATGSITFVRPSFSGPTLTVTSGANVLNTPISYNVSITASDGSVHVTTSTFIGILTNATRTLTGSVTPGNNSTSASVGSNVTYSILGGTSTTINRTFNLKGTKTTTTDNFGNWKYTWSVIGITDR